MADIRIHDITGEVTIARFPRAEAKALKPISGIPPFRATRELIRRVGSDCTVEIDGNAYWAIDPADYAGVAGANGRYAATPPPACCQLQRRRAWCATLASTRRCSGEASDGSPMARTCCCWVG
jgi:hypothetical protein